MSTAPNAPKDSTRETAGWNLALLGGVAAAIGILLMILFEGGIQTLGIVIAFFAVMPTVVGFLIVIGKGVSRRAEQGKPFA